MIKNYPKIDEEKTVGPCIKVVPGEMYLHCVGSTNLQRPVKFNVLSYFQNNAQNSSLIRRQQIIANYSNKNKHILNDHLSNTMNAN